MTLLLRGANDFMLDEIDRSMHDALSIVKRVLESGTMVPGGGCVETALSVYLESFATTLGSREQLAIAEFADALLVIPKTLSVNAAKDATELVAKLRAYHHAAQTKSDKKGVTTPFLQLSMCGIRIGELWIGFGQRQFERQRCCWCTGAGNGKNQNASVCH